MKYRYKVSYKGGKTISLYAYDDEEIIKIAKEYSSSYGIIDRIWKVDDNNGFDHFINLE
jgi:hypothetical protein